MAIYHNSVTRLWATVLLLCLSGHALAAQYSLVTKASARAEINDNIFITSAAHDSVSGLVVTPQARLLVKEPNWQSYLNSKLVFNRYSDSNLDSNDVLFDWSSSYSLERHELSLDVKYNKDSTLNSASSDFGVVARRVKSRSSTLAPSYQYIASQRARLSLSANRTQVDYSDDVGFIAYSLDGSSASWLYDLSEKNTVSLTLQGSKYRSDNGVYQYNLTVLQIGLRSRLNRLWLFDGAIGNSRRASSNQATSTINFFGQTINIVNVNNITTTGLVYDATFTRDLERGDFGVTFSRNNATNSFGGLNEVSSLKLAYQYQISDLWRQVILIRYENVNSVSSGVSVTDRSMLLFEIRLIRQVDRQWSINASYRYAARQFDTLVAADASSNRLFLGLTYNFPDVSTF